MSDVAPIRPDPEGEIKKALAGAGQSKPEVKPVAKGRVSKSIGATVARSIFAESVSGVGNYVLHELILPNIREMIQSVVVGGIERALYGDSAPKPYRPRTGYGFYSAPSRPAGWTSRTNYSAGAPTPRDDQWTNRPPSYSDLVVPSRQEAEDVLQALLDMAERYGSASVGDLFSLAGMSTTHVDESWTWNANEVSQGRVQMRRGGYGFSLPSPSFKSSR